MSTKTEAPEKTEQTTAQDAPAPAQTGPGLSKVENISQAIDVLCQAVEQGRTKGIFTFEDIEILIPAMKLAKIESNKKLLETRFAGQLFVAKDNENAEAVDPANYFEDGTDADLTFEAVEMKTQFVCVTNAGQLTGFAGDYLVKLSDNFYVPLAINPAEKAEAESTDTEG